MRQELSGKIVNDFPKIFPDGVFYFETDDGWYWLIYSLCQKLQNDIDNRKEPQIKAFQIKEKFGSLRFYVDCCIDTQTSIIDFAELLSLKICEVCGTFENVYLMNRCGTFKTICKKCENKLYE
jgi:hypothetical protein